MPVICLGPVCVPLHLLLPFLVALAHRHGYMTWFKREWVTLAWWLALLRVRRPNKQEAQEVKQSDAELVEHCKQGKAGPAEAAAPGGKPADDARDKKKAS